MKYIRDKNNFGLIYYAKIEDAYLSDLLLKAVINTENQLIVFYDSIRKDCPYTFRSTGAYIVFYQVGLTDNCTHVPGPAAQSSSQSDYNAVCMAGMTLGHFRILNNDFLNNDTDVVP